MQKLILKLLPGFVLLIASQACAPQGVTTSDPNFINTAIAGTMAAASTQTSQPGMLVPDPESSAPAARQDSSPTSTPLSAFIPSPTPTPNFAASYSGLESCKGMGWWVDIRLQNSGGMVFQSIAMTVRNTTTNTVVSLYADNFTNKIGCIESYTQDNLPPGATLLVSSPAFTYKPTGRTFRATITLCSGSGQSGLCLTQVIDFTP
jgi:hypothetical protein